MPDRVLSALEISAREAADSAGPKLTILDIRSEAERRIGIARGSEPCDPDELMALLDRQEPLPVQAGLVMCGAGIRSRVLVEALHRRGVTTFRSIAGGFAAWRAEGLPAEYPPGLGARGSERYARHLVMPQVGPAGQLKLLQSRILLIGMGGLSSPAALYLAAAGVGRLGLVDDDRVERSNLQRQVVHSEATVGMSKIESAGAALQRLNPDVQIEPYELRVGEDNAADLVRGWDVVIDGSDNFPTRYALNAACLQHRIPLVYGAVMRFQGQVSVFAATSEGERSACFQCLFPAPPPAADAPACSVAGVLGVMPGIVGTLQACEALKWVLGIGTPLVGRLLMIDALNMEFTETRLQRDPKCSTCGA